jgi:hypothetical protein
MYLARRKVMKNKVIKISATALAVVLMYSASALAQVGISSNTETIVTTKKTTQTVPVLPVPATAAVETTVTTTTAPVTTTRSETHWVTEEKPVIMPGAIVYNVIDFDLNSDRLLSLNEVGEKLFKMYDTDGNNVIDNIEFERRAVLTVVPVEKNTTITYDFNGDGLADQVATTSQVFLQGTQLARFDRNGDGLSPREFSGRSFLEADINNDKAVDLSEWRGVYVTSIDIKNKEDARFN